MPSPYTSSSHFSTCLLLLFSPRSFLTLLQSLELPGTSVYGILQATILEWVAISFSRGSSRPRHWTQVSCIGRQILYHWATWEASLCPTCVYTCISVWKRMVQQQTNDWYLHSSRISAPSPLRVLLPNLVPFVQRGGGI